MKKWLYGVVVGVAAFFGAQAAFAGSEVDTLLLKKLQEKGILSSSEAKEIADEIAKETAGAAAAEKRAEAEKKETPAAAKAVELPDWIKNTKLKGNLRLRYETRDRQDDQRGTQGRARFRLTAGLETAITDQVAAGFGLGSGTGDPRSKVQTFGNDSNEKGVWIDNAFIRYAPTKWFSAIGGKFVNPIWQPSDMLISTEINPEGSALRLEGQVAPNLGLFFNGGAFVLDDRTSASPSTADPLLYVFQPGVKWNITKDTFVRFAPAYYLFANQKHAAVLTPANTALSSSNTAVNGRYAYNYSAINWGGEVGFNNPFGISAIPYFGIMGGYVHNTDPSKNNDYYLAGFSVGYTDVKKFGDWAFEYTYRRVEKDAWFDLLPDLAFYCNSNGSGGNTNVAGHRAKFLFGLTKNTALQLTAYDTWKIRNFNPSSSTTIPGATRTFSAEEFYFIADLIVKF